jgi:DNA-binding MarR family transcriptional regulator
MPALILTEGEKPEMPRAPLEHEELLSPAEMAAAWRVTTRTITRWGAAGYLTVKLTPGDTRRYLASETPAGRAAKAGEES